MDRLSDTEAAAGQYRTPDRLETRISIHDKYSTNPQGFGNWITSHYRFPEGASVLELGCGTGRMWLGEEERIGRCGRLILSDLSEGMLEKARETLRGAAGITYAQIDICSIPFPDRTFDAVIANMMLYHVPDPGQAIREVSRVLKDDGVFHCASYGEHGLTARLAELFAAYGAAARINSAFTLQNGAGKLAPYFAAVEEDRYDDSLAVTDPEDMADYIASLGGMTELRKLPRETILAVLRANAEGGVLRLPKEYGMFTARFPVRGGG